MKVLFITSSRIGDAVLTTGLLDYISQSHPDAKVTIVCAPLVQSLFEGYPNLEKIISLKKQKHNKHWMDLWKQVAPVKWDMVIDIRNSLVSRLVRAKKRYIFGGHIDQKLHKVEQAGALMKLAQTPAPKLWFTAAQKQKAEGLIPCGDPVLGIGPTANWIGKTWPAERFIEVIKFMTAPNGPMPNARVAIFAAPGEEDVARQVFNTIPEDRRIDVIAKTDPATAAATIARCDFYIGNDSGLMHCAAAAGVPTLGLFGPSYPHLYRPWGADYISTPETFDQLINYPGYTPATAPCLMGSLSVEMVQEKLREIFAKRKAA